MEAFSMNPSNINLSDIKRNGCKECPWSTKSVHNERWPEYVSKMTEEGYIDSGVHGCHMITNDTWGMDKPINKDNVCVGSLRKIK